MRKLVPSLLVAVFATPVVAPAASEDLIFPTNTAARLAAIIDPTLGSIQVMSFQLNSSEYKRSSSFLRFIEGLDARPAGPEPQVAGMSAMRVGGFTQGAQAVTSPSPLRLLAEIEAASRQRVAALNARPGAVEQAVRIREMEDAYWNSERPFDGKVSAAANGDALLIGVPSKRTLVLYDLVKVADRNFEPVAFRPTSAEMFMPAIWGTSLPDQTAILRQCTEALRRRYAANPEELKRAEEAANEAINAFSVGPGVAAAAAPVSPLPQPDWWIGGISGANGAAANSNQPFVLIDAATRRMMLYRIEGSAIVLKAVRNIGIDLYAFSLAGDHFGSRPTDAEALRTLLSRTDYMLAAQRYRLLDLPKEPALQVESLRSQLTSLVSSQRKSGGSGQRPLQAVTMGDQVIVSLPAERKVLTFLTNGGNALNLTSLRDTTVDQGVSVLATMIRDREEAGQIMAQLVKGAATIPVEQLRRYLDHCLTRDPFLVAQIDGNPAFVKFVGEAWWQPLVDAAKAKAKEIEDALKAQQQNP